MTQPKRQSSGRRRPSMPDPVPLSLTPLEAEGIHVTPVKGNVTLGHILIGQPEDDCPVCKAHPGGAISTEQMKTCRCPLCVDMRKTVKEVTGELAD